MILQKKQFLELDQVELSRRISNLNLNLRVEAYFNCASYALLKLCLSLQKSHLKKISTKDSTLGYAIFNNFGRESFLESETFDLFMSLENVADVFFRLFIKDDNAQIFQRMSWSLGYLKEKNFLTFINAISLKKTSDQYTYKIVRNLLQEHQLSHGKEVLKNYGYILMTESHMEFFRDCDFEALITSNFFQRFFEQKATIYYIPEVGGLC